VGLRKRKRRKQRVDRGGKSEAEVVKNGVILIGKTMRGLILKRLMQGKRKKPKINR